MKIHAKRSSTKRLPSLCARLTKMRNLTSGSSPSKGWLSQEDRGGTFGYKNRTRLLARYLKQPVRIKDDVLNISRREIIKTAWRKTLLLTSLSRSVAQILAVGWSVIQGITISSGSKGSRDFEYLQLSPGQLERINFSPSWKRWRAIPLALSGTVPNRALTVIDMCCGTGESTEILAHYLPGGSQILGVDVNSVFVARAKCRRYTNKNGRTCQVAFATGTPIETFLDPRGNRIEGNSIDLVHCSGAPGQHFQYTECIKFAKETWRILRRGAAVIVDVRGRKDREMVRTIFSRVGFIHKQSVKSCFLDRTCFEVFVKT